MNGDLLRDLKFDFDNTIKLVDAGHVVSIDDFCHIFVSPKDEGNGFIFAVTIADTCDGSCSSIVDDESARVWSIIDGVASHDGMRHYSFDDIDYIDCDKFIEIFKTLKQFEDKYCETKKWIGEINAR